MSSGLTAWTEQNTSFKNEDSKGSRYSIREQKNAFEIAHLCDHRTSGPDTSLICLQVLKMCYTFSRK